MCPAGTDVLRDQLTRRDGLRSGDRPDQALPSRICSGNCGVVLGTTIATTDNSPTVSNLRLRHRYGVFLTAVRRRMRDQALPCGSPAGWHVRCCVETWSPGRSVP